jgi:hypothetical protein
MKKLILAFILAAALVSPALASTYQYVDTSGNLQEVQADSSAAAIAAAVNIAPNSGVVLVSESNPVVTPAPSTEASLHAQIDALLAQVASLQVQLSNLGGGVASTTPAGSTVRPGHVTNSRVNDTPDQAEKKGKAQQRGVGIAKTHIALEDGIVNVSMSDYFEGEQVAISAVGLDAEGSETGSVNGNSDGSNCGGKIANSDLTVCSTNTTFELGDNAALRVTVGYGGREQNADISRGNRSEWMDWSE